MIAKFITWCKKYLTKESPPATFFHWMEVNKAPSIVNWAGTIEDQWSVEEGSASWADDLECGYPRLKKESI